MSFSETDVQNALKNLIDPNTKKDFVSGKSVKNVKISGSDVSLDILLGYPAKSVWDEIRAMVEAHLKAILAGCGQGQRQRVQQGRAARGAARREAGGRREEHHRGGERQGRRGQIHHRGESGAGAGRRRRARRRAGCRYLRPFATDHAGHFRPTQIGRRQIPGTDDAITACRPCPSAS